MSDSTVNVRLSADVAQFIASMNAAAASTKTVTASGRDLNKLGAQFSSAGRMLTMGLTAPITAAGVASVGMSNKFSTSFTRMTTLAGISTSEIGKLRQSVLNLSGATGRGPQELADALYAASSSGLDAAQSMAAVEIAAKGAAAGLGNTGDIISLVASATASYGSEMMSASKATDILVGTIREGRADPDELAGSLGRILPTAAALGVTFEEVGGTVAFLSNVFGDTDRTVTAIGDAFAKLQSPTQQGREALMQYGSSMEELHRIIAEDGLLGAMQHLRDIGLSDDPLAFRAVFEDQNARQGALAMIGNLEGLETAIDGVKSSSGALAEAWNAVQGESGFEMAQAWAEIQVALVEFGDAIGPIAADVAGAVADIASAFASLPSGVQTAIAGVLTAVGPLAMVAGTIMKHAQTIAKARLLMAGVPGAGLALPAVGLGLGWDFLLDKVYSPDNWTGGRGAPDRPLDPSSNLMYASDAQLAQAAANGITTYEPGWSTAGQESPFTNEFSMTPPVWSDFGTPLAQPSATRPFVPRVDAEGNNVPITMDQASLVLGGVQSAAGGASMTTAAIAKVREETERLVAATQGYAAVTATMDWGAAGFAGAQAGMAKWSSEFFALTNIAMASEEAYDRLSDAVEKNGMTFDVATPKGRENQQALQSLSSTLDTQFVAAYDAAGGSMEAFMASADAIGLQTIARLSEELGISTEAATELAAGMLGLTQEEYIARFNLSGTEEAKVKLGLLQGTIGLLHEDVQREVAMQIATGDFQGALDTVQANIAETPESKTVTFSAVDNVTATANRIQRVVNGLTGKTITITTNRVTRESTYDYTGGTGEKATAMGGYFDGPDVRLIGEAGAEVVLPLTRPGRLAALLSDPRVFTPIAAAMGGGGGSISGGGSSGSGGAPSFDVRVYVGNREITDIVRTEFRARDDRQLAGSRF